MSIISNSRTTRGDIADSLHRSPGKSIHTTVRLFEIGSGVLRRRFTQFVEHRRRLSFGKKVRRALSDLGLRVSHFERRLKRLYLDVCDNCYRQDKLAANAHALAIEFFLRLVIEYPAVVGNAVMYKGVLIESISVIRSWHLRNRVDAATATRSIDQIKRSLLRQLEALELSSGEKLAAEIQVLEL